MPMAQGLSVYHFCWHAMQAPQVSGWLHAGIQLVEIVLTVLSSVQREQQTTLSTACGNVSGRDRAQVTDCLGPWNVISERLHCVTIMQDHEVANGQSMHALGDLSLYTTSAGMPCNSPSIWVVAC